MYVISLLQVTVKEFSFVHLYGFTSVDLIKEIKSDQDSKKE